MPGMTQGDVEARQRGMRSDQFSGLMLLALALYVGWENRVYPLGTLQEPGPGYMPLLLAVFLGAMGLMIALRGGKSDPLSSLGWSEARRAVLILIIGAVGAAALEHIGYRLTMIGLLVFFLGVLERKKPWAVAIAAFGFSLVSYYVFATLLQVPLPVSHWGF